jgi:hypothetical protein
VSIGGGAAVIRRLTLRTIGIAAAVVGAAALVAPFAWRSFWPTPYATIELPDSSASAGECFVVRGDVAPSTIWQPLWLIQANDEGWRPLGKIDPSPGTWQRKVCVSGHTGGKYRLALVLADRDRDQAFRSELVEREDQVPEWLKPDAYMQQGGRGRRHHGLDLIPEGANAIASVAVNVLDGDEQAWMSWQLHDDCAQHIPSLEQEWASYERERNQRRDARRVLRSHGAVQVTARAVPAAGDR